MKRNVVIIQDRKQAMKGQSMKKEKYQHECKREANMNRHERFKKQKNQRWKGSDINEE